jgi:hypothetical protein
MATKPLLPEVIAERAKAADDYRKAHQAAIDRIEKLRAARMQRDAKIQAAQAGPAADTNPSKKRASAAGAKRAKVSNGRASAHQGA